MAQRRAKDIEEKEEARRHKKAPQPLYDQRKQAAVPEDSRAGPAETVLNLQQTYGNRYVQRVMGKVQAKLIVNPPDDQYEREADRVANAVTKASAPSIQRLAEEEEEEIQSKPIAEQITPLIQRQEEEPIQTKLTDDMQVQRQAEEPEEEEEEEEEPIQTKKAGRQTPLVSSRLQSQINSLKGGGQPLPESTRKYFEPRFGSRFNNVRIHNNSQAANTAKSINAKAFTTGKDIVFGTGQYSPETSEGERLLAHELTHVVQQDASTVRGGEISKPNEPAEAEAQRVGEAISCDRQLLPIKASAAQVSRRIVSVLPGISGIRGLPWMPVSSARKPCPEATDNKLVGKLEHQVKKAGGITVALYAMRGVKYWSEFERQADKFAIDYDAVGIARDGKVKIPQAMMLSSPAGTLVRRTITRVDQVLVDAPSVTTFPRVQVKTLAIFTHGEFKAPHLLIARGTRSVTIPYLKTWVASLAPYLAPDVKVVLYACWTAAGKMNFAEQLHSSLTAALATIFPAKLVGPEVWGHTGYGHTTAYARLRVFYQKGYSEALDEQFAIGMLCDALKAYNYNVELPPKKEKSLLKELKNWAENILMGGKRQSEKLDPAIAKYIRDIPFRPLGISDVYDEIKAGKAPVAAINNRFKFVMKWLMRQLKPYKRR